MKKRKYPYMIVGGNYLSIGSEGPNGMRVSIRIPWSQVLDAKLDVVETNLDILEYKIDQEIERARGKI